MWQILFSGECKKDACMNEIMITALTRKYVAACLRPYLVVQVSRTSKEAEQRANFIDEA